MASQHQQTPLYHHPHQPLHFYGYPPQQPLYHEPVLPLAYRAVPLHQDQQQQQQQLSLAAPGVSGLHLPTAIPTQQQPTQIAYRTRQQSIQAHAAMAESSFQQPGGATEDEMAEMQKLSNDYQPEAKGPLVGQRQPSTAITTEYASADPVLQAKTAKLPQKYSYYRTVRGDGSCGWRAIVFGYFETLIHLGDVNKFGEEEARLRSLRNLVAHAGYDPDMYDDFADQVWELMRNLMAGVQDGTAEAVLETTFNEEYVQNYIITCFRTLTAAWMKTKATDYQAWVLGATVDQYCTNQILPISSELEHVSLMALKDVLISPAGITLEVLYLDRSEGAEVNMHRFSPLNSQGYDIGTIRLLYRPGHYDIVYMPQDLPPVSVAAPVETYLQYSSQTYNEVYDLGMHDFMVCIPGMSYANPQRDWMPGSSFHHSDYLDAPTPVQPCPLGGLPAPVAAIPQQQMQAASTFVTAPQTHLVAPPTQLADELVIRTVPQHAASSNTSTQNAMSAGPFRRSHWEWECNFASQVPLQTSQFRNSHFNTAHFLNPDFQPEEWHPEDEYINTRSGKHKNNG